MGAPMRWAGNVARVQNERAALAKKMAPPMASAPNDPVFDLNPAHGAPQQGAALQPRVREMFPETLLWRPELITDDDGNATLPLDLADSITTWRLSASAVAGDGRLGAL